MTEQEKNLQLSTYFGEFGNYGTTVLLSYNNDDDTKNLGATMSVKTHTYGEIETQLTVYNPSVESLRKLAENIFKFIDFIESKAQV